MPLRELCMENREYGMHCAASERLRGPRLSRPGHRKTPCPRGSIGFGGRSFGKSGAKMPLAVATCRRAEGPAAM
jgi:hypothetical protein